MGPYQCKMQSCLHCRPQQSLGHALLCKRDERCPKAHLLITHQRVWITNSMAAERRHVGGAVTSCEACCGSFSLRFAAAAGSSAPSTGMDTRRSLSWMFLATVICRLGNVIAERSRRERWDSSSGLRNDQRHDLAHSIVASSVRAAGQSRCGFLEILVLRNTM